MDILQRVMMPLNIWVSFIEQAMSIVRVKMYTSLDRRTKPLGWNPDASTFGVLNRICIGVTVIVY